MAEPLGDWIERAVRPYEKKSVAWLSSNHFFRDPVRGSFVDPDYFFSPADGIILYQKVVAPSDPIVDVKGVFYTLRDLMMDPLFNKESLVVGVFMTFYDVHINRIPYSGRLRYERLPCIDSHNHPMLEVEKSILRTLKVPQPGTYLRHNERMLNTIFSSTLQQQYYVVQIADFDVDSICHFDAEQNRAVAQSERFSQIRYGSQVDLIIPISENYTFEFCQREHTHVEAAVDPLVRIIDCTNGWKASPSI